MATKRFLLFAILVAWGVFHPVCAQISVNPSTGKTPEDIVREVIMGEGVIISNVQFNGIDGTLGQQESSQLGTFSNNENGFPGFFASGIILCTGYCKVAEGPNNDSGKTQAAEGNKVKCKELESIVSPYSVNHPAVLEFDFSSVTSHVQFRYVFASEEYPVCSCSQFNDVFGFFVKDAKNGKTKNIALIPGTKDAVSVNNIHPDYGAGCKAVNEEYLTMLPNGAKEMQFNGFVGPFVAEADLEPNRTYHIKLAISNVSDMQLESAVFIEALSFNAVDDYGVVCKSDGTPSSYSVTDTVPETTIEVMTLDDINDEGGKSGVSFQELGYGGEDPFDPERYIITAETPYGYLFDTVAAGFVDDSIVVRLHSQGQWCNCFVPEEVPVTVVLTPKSANEDGTQLQQIVIPLVVPVVDGSPWLSRCLWVLVTIGALLLLIFYLRALLRKRRFKKSARIKNTYVELKGGVQRESELQNGLRLREKGFGPWFKRWFVPYPDERRTQPWQTPPAGSLTFVAGRSKETVDVVHSSFNEQKLRMDTYDPNNEDEKKKKLLEMGTIKVYEQKQYKGRLEYDSGSRDDEKYYRIMLVVLMLVSVAAIAVLVFFMLKAFL